MQVWYQQSHFRFGELTRLENWFLGFRPYEHTLAIAMPAHMELIWWLFFLSLWGYLLWSWTIWFKSRDKTAPRWRAIAFVAGLCSATVSTILGAFLFVHATVTGGYAFYHPVELFCIRVGSLTALLGLAAGLTGRAKVRLAVTVISTLNLLLWFMDAVWQ